MKSDCDDSDNSQLSLYDNNDDQKPHSRAIKMRQNDIGPVLSTNTPATGEQ